MSKRKNWNMLHFNRCPLCGNSLVPKNADATLLECIGAYEKKPCTFKIRPYSMFELRKKMVRRVGLST